MNARLATPALVLAALGGILFLLLRDAPRDGERRAPVPAPAGEGTAAPEIPLPERPASAPGPESGGGTASAEDDLRTRFIEILDESTHGNSIEEARSKILAHREALEAFLAQLGPEHVALIHSMLRNEPDFLDRRALIRRLGEIGSDEAVDLLVDHYWLLAYQDKETELNYTIEAIGLAQSPHSFVRLEQLIANDEDAVPARLHRFRFVEELGRHPDNLRAVPTFLRVADSANEPYFKTRMRAALALKWVDDPRTSPQVERLLDSEEDKYVRQALCGTLGDLGDPKSVPKLATIARTDENHQTRMSAVRALSRIGGDEARAIIEEVRASDGHERVRLEASRAIEKLDSSG